MPERRGLPEPEFAGLCAGWKLCRLLDERRLSRPDEAGLRRPRLRGEVSVDRRLRLHERGLRRRLRSLRGVLLERRLFLALAAALQRGDQQLRPVLRQHRLQERESPLLLADGSDLCGLPERQQLRRSRVAFLLRRRVPCEVQGEGRLPGDLRPVPGGHRPLRRVLHGCRLQRPEAFEVQPRHERLRSVRETSRRFGGRRSSVHVERHDVGGWKRCLIPRGCSRSACPRR
jgi:hypothetical protein